MARRRGALCCHASPTRCRGCACYSSVAERLPFRTGAFDAAMAIFTIHHWSDVRQGLVEMRRVAKQRLIILTWEQAVDLIAILWAPLTCYQFRFRTIVQTVLISRFGDA